MQQSNIRNKYIYLAMLILLFFFGIIIASKSTGWLVSYMVLILYYLLIFITMKISKLFDVFKMICFRDKLVSICCSIFLLFVVIVIISREKFVYFWDYSSYMYYTVNVSDGFTNANFLDVLKSLYNSINYDEYNYLICYIIAIPFKLLKQSYLAFEVLICIMFLIPGVYIISFFIYKLCRRYFNAANYGMIHIIVSLFPAYLYVLLLGYADAVGLPFMGLSFYLALKMENKFDWKYCCLMSLNLVLLMMLRRWYAAFILSFVLFLITKEALCCLFLIKEEKKAKILIFLKNYILVGCISTVIFITILNGMLKILLFNNYSTSYQGWNTTDLTEKWLLWFKYFGIAVIAFMSFAVIAEIVERKKCNFWCVSTIPGIVASAVYFWHLADMPEHVYYIFCVQLCFGFAIGIQWIVNWIGNRLVISGKQKRKFLNASYIACIFFTILNCLVMLSIVPITNEKITLFTGNRYEPRIRDDIESLQNLQEYLGNITKETENNKVYIAASGKILNDDILRRLNAPDYTLPYTLLPTTHADLVGGFNIDFLDASIVVITEPIQTHLLEGSQQVLQYIVNGVLNSDSFIGKKYEQCQVFELDNNILAKVFKKCDYYTEDDILKIKNYFDSIYPDNPEIFRDKFEEYLNNTFPHQNGMSKVIYPSDQVLHSNYYNNGRIISTGADNLSFGPYETILPGTYTVCFEYEYKGNVDDTEQIGYIDVNIPSLSSEKYDSMQVFAFAGETTVSIQNWTVDAEYPQAEIRFYSYVPGIEIKKVTVTHQ